MWSIITTLTNGRVLGNRQDRNVVRGSDKAMTSPQARLHGSHAPAPASAPTFMERCAASAGRMAASYFERLRSGLLGIPTKRLVAVRVAYPRGGRA